MRRFLFVFLLLSGLAPLSAQAASRAWEKDEDVSVRLISALEGTGTETRIPLGFEIKLAPGSHTYWRSPGEAGLPPQFDWLSSTTGGGNLLDARVLFPAPKRLSEQGIETFGYSGHVVLPIDAYLREPGKALIADAKLDLLVCSATCVPKRFSLRLALPEGDAIPGPEAPIIRKAQALVPSMERATVLSITGVERRANGIKITVAKQGAFNKPDLFVENAGNVVFAKPVLTLIDDKSTASFTLAPQEAAPENVSLTTLPLTVTVIDGDQAIERTLDGSFYSQTNKTGSFLFFFVLAVLGGFILNLTPCVLPVLSLKILGIINHGGGKKRAVRRSFLTTAAGILFSFLLLAGAAIGLKATGQAIGWGMQFQQPVFLVFLILILTFFAANLWGFYEIVLPRFLADRAGRSFHPKLAGDFASGAFATLLATPCTVPFLGTAIGFALAAGPMEILAVFAALGLGMALPYLGIAAWPRLAMALPRPGKWMIRLKHILGWALALTVAWLISVLMLQISFASALKIAGGIIILILMLFLQRRELFRRFSRMIIAVIVLFSFGIVFSSESPHDSPSVNNGWHKFDEASIIRFVNEGKIVFVDITASWCVNCKVNQRFALSHENVIARLFYSPDVIAMQGDWTNPDPVITKFLRSHGRYGIPFNVVFGPKAPQGIILPELITPGRVIEALDNAR